MCTWFFVDGDDAWFRDCIEEEGIVVESTEREREADKRRRDGTDGEKREREGEEERKEEKRGKKGSQGCVIRPFSTIIYIYIASRLGYNYDMYAHIIALTPRVQAVPRLLDYLPQYS